MTHCWEHFTFAKHSLSPTHPSTEQCPALVLRSEKNSCLWNAGSKITPCPQQRVPGAESTAGVQRCHCPGMRLCTKTNTATAAKWLVFGWHRLVSAHSTCKKTTRFCKMLQKKTCKGLDAHTGAAPDGAQLTHPSAQCACSPSLLSLPLFKAEHRRPQQRTQHSAELTPHHLPGLAIGIPFITSARDKLGQHCLSQASDSFKYPASYFPLL